MGLVPPLLLPKQVHFVSEYFPNTTPYYSDLQTAINDMESGGMVISYMPVSGSYTPKADVRVFFYHDISDDLNPADFIDNSIIMKDTISGVEVWTGILRTELSPFVSTREYVVRLSQTGTDDPVLTQICRNNNNYELVLLTYEGAGTYSLTFSSALSNNMALIELTSGIATDANGEVRGYITYAPALSTFHYLWFHTYDLGGNLANDLLTDSLIKITVYTGQ